MSLPTAGYAAGADSLALVASTVAAPVVIDSVVVDSAVVDSATVPPSAEPIRVELERDATITAALVVWHSDGYLLAVHSNGSEELIGAHRVRKIYDETGRDRTHFVIYERGAVGTSPLTFHGKVDPERYHQKKRLSPLVGIPLFAAAVVVGVAVLSAYHPPSTNWWTP
jgi:hypothetical protein